MRAPIFFISLFLLPVLHAQETTGAVPMSQRLSLEGASVPTLEAGPFDAEAATLDDAERDLAGKLPLYARFVPLSATLSNAGTWTELGGGDRIWRLRVASPGALATELFFERSHLPMGAQVHLYDDDGGQLLGGYTSAHVQSDGMLSTGMIKGESCVIEYHEPAAVRGEGVLDLVRVAHAYRFAEQLKSDACEVDVNCGEGSGWANERDAVVRIRVVIPSGAGYCTGTLMNNTANDCKGYVLTAFHCTQESVEANYGAYTFRFRYQRTTCATGSATGNDMTGCVRRAGSQDEGGQFGSDYSLVELNASIPASYAPYWAGWDVTEAAPTSGVCIHHPDSDVKKISTYSATATSTSWAGFTSGSHWQVYWVGTANGHGVTEPGSSGAPLFDQNKRVVGTLTGGASCCTVNGCNPPPTGPDYPDKFGKMGYHWWENNPNPTIEELHWWLAPVGNPDHQNGSASPCTPIGMEEMGMPTPEVFPNPTSSTVTMRVPGIQDLGAQLIVSDVTGRVVHRERVNDATTVMDVRAWGTGVFFITLSAQGRRPSSVRVGVID